jgi:AcrR family transcriptional regulator
MGSSERRARAKVALRQQILDAARELFVREGYDAVSMRRIAARIEYSPTAIYLHFEDKEDLVLALCRQDFGRLLSAMEGQAPPGDPIEGLRQLGRAYARFAIDNPNQYRFMFMSPMKPDHSPEPTDPGHLSYGVLRDAVAKAIEAGALRPADPDTVAQVLWSSIHGAVALLITMRPDCWPRPPAANLIDETIEAGLRAFGTLPAGSE